jgi:hypothetical protein
MIPGSSSEFIFAMMRPLRPAFAAAVDDLHSSEIDRVAVRTYAEGFSWDRTSQDQLALFESLSAPA